MFSKLGTLTGNELNLFVGFEYETCKLDNYYRHLQKFLYGCNMSRDNIQITTERVSFIF